MICINSHFILSFSILSPFSLALGTPISINYTEILASHSFSHLLPVFGFWLYACVRVWYLLSKKKKKKREERTQIHLILMVSSRRFRLRLCLAPVFFFHPLLRPTFWWLLSRTRTDRWVKKWKELRSNWLNNRRISNRKHRVLLRLP